MKNHLLALGVAIAFNLSAEEPAHVHCFSPKFFFKNHDEINYKYDTWGVGLQYVLKRPQGINVKLSMVTNPQTKNILIQTDECIYFKTLVRPNHYLYPLLSSRNSTHNVYNRKQEVYIVKKSSLFAGFGWEWEFLPGFNGRIETQGFRDIHNAIVVRSGDTFKGKSFSAPWGVQAKIGFAYEWGTHSNFEVEGHYARTLSKCYSEYGTEISYNWGF